MTINGFQVSAQQLKKIFNFSLHAKMLDYSLFSGTAELVRQFFIKKQSHNALSKSIHLVVLNEIACFAVADYVRCSPDIETDHR